MKTLNEEKIKQLLEEQKQLEGESLNEQEQQLYTLLHESFHLWEDEEISVVNPVMQKLAEMEDRKESNNSHWILMGAIAIVLLTTALTYYFFMPADFHLAVAFIKAHTPIVLFIIGMFFFVQFADRKLLNSI